AMLRRLLEGAVSSIVFFWDVRRSSCRGSAIHGHLYSTIGWIQPAASVGRASLSDMALRRGPGRNQTILLVSVPIFSIQILTTSPGLRNSPRAAPTPAG